MSNFITTLDAKQVESYAGTLGVQKTGFLFASAFLILMDGVNGAAASTLRSYLSGGLHANPDEITWGSIFYYVGKLYMLLLAAKFQRLFGQRRSILTASTVLVLATAAGAFVPNYPSFLLVLLIQGCGGGAMIALGQGTLLSIFPRRDQPIVQGIYALASVMFPATVVPLLLGGSAYNFDWRFAYLWITPFGLLGCLWHYWQRKWLSNAVLPTVVMPRRIILVVTALFSIVYVLQQGERNRWFEYPPIVWASLLAVTCAVALAFLETRGGPTLLPYGAFRYANFTFGVTVIVLAGIALFGSGTMISGFATTVLAYPVSVSGLVQLSGTVLAVFSFLGVGLLIRFAKMNPIYSILTGLLCFATSMWNLGYAPSNLDFGGFAILLIIRGFAFGCQFIPLTLLSLTCLPPEEDVAAAGIFNFNRNIGALVGIAWLQTLLETKTDRNQTIFGNAVSWISPNAVNYNHAVQQALSSFGAQPWRVPASSTALTLQEAHRQWLSIAYNGCFESLALVFFFAFPLVATARILTTRFLKPPECQ